MIYKYTKYEWWGHPDGYPEEGDAGGNISHEQASSRSYFDGGGTHMMMMTTGYSHKYTL